MRDNDFTRCEMSHSCYIKKLMTTILLCYYIYVDDMLLVGSNKQKIYELKQ